MQISKDKVVTFFYQLSDSTGKELENNFNSTPMAYLHGHNNTFAALENALEGLSVGDEKEVNLSAKEAYGERRPDAHQKIPVKHLLSKHKKLLPGQFVKVNSEKGPLDASVVKAGKFMVELDFNHPLAGMALCFKVKIDSIRDASADEVSHGHAHGVGGHHH